VGSGRKCHIRVGVSDRASTFPSFSGTREGGGTEKGNNKRDNERFRNN
jgi:hypothetical protein